MKINFAKGNTMEIIDILQEEKTKLEQCHLSQLAELKEAQVELKTIQNKINYQKQMVPLFVLFDKLNEEADSDWEKKIPDLNQEPYSYEKANTLISFAKDEYPENAEVIKLVGILVKKMDKESLVRKRILNCEKEVNDTQSKINEKDTLIFNYRLSDKLSNNDKIKNHIKSISKLNFLIISVFLVILSIFIIVILTNLNTTNDINVLIKKEQETFRKVLLNSTDTKLNAYQTVANADKKYLSIQNANQEYLTITEATDKKTGFATVSTVNDLSNKVTTVRSEMKTFTDKSKKVLDSLDDKFNKLKGEVNDGLVTKIHSVVDPLLIGHISIYNGKLEDVQSQVDKIQVTVDSFNSNQLKLITEACSGLRIDYTDICKKVPKNVKSDDVSKLGSFQNNKKPPEV